MRHSLSGDLPTITNELHHHDVKITTLIALVICFNLLHRSLYEITWLELFFKAFGRIICSKFHT